MTILEEIVAHKKQEIKGLSRDLDVEKCCTNFAQIFDPTPGLIAEIKSKSPSEGVIAENFDPVSQAKAYEVGGANAMSILTDHKYFGGSFDVLRAVRAVTDKPLLCKEFIIDERQIDMARHCGADMVLLIVKILSDGELENLKDKIESLGMLPIIEVQNDEETDRALKTDPEVLLINNRNLSSFDVDMDTTVDLLGRIPDEVKVIAASGIRNPSEIAGFPERVNGFLIGTSLMRSTDPTRFLKEARDAKA